MTGLLDWLPALVATLASIAGILVGVDQLTTGARLRKKASFWEEQLASPKLSSDTEVMRSLQRETTARLAALEGYPGSRVLTPFYFILLCPFFSGFSANGLASLYQENRFDLERIVSHLLSFMVAVWVFPAGIVLLASIIAARRLLVHRYLEGRHLSHDLPDDLPLASFGWSLRRALEFKQLIAFSLTVNLAAAFVGVSLVYPGLPEAYFSSSVWVRAPLGTLALFLVTIGLREAVRMFTGGELIWEHPRTIPATDGAHGRVVIEDNEQNPLP